MDFDVRHSRLDVRDAPHTMGNGISAPHPSEDGDGNPFRTAPTILARTI